MDWLRVEPLDVLCARGNRLFGEPGSFGTVGMPPWPSVFAGALRSWIFAAAKADPRDLLLGNLRGHIAQALGNGVPTGRMLEDGSPEYAVRSGSFRIAWLSLMGSEELLVPTPNDLAVGRPRETPSGEGDEFVHGVPLGASFLKPVDLPEEIRSSLDLDRHLVLRSRANAKPENGFWIDSQGLERYLNGLEPTPDQLIPVSQIWKTEERIGIGMDPLARVVETGKLFTSEAIRLLGHAAFLVAVEGADGLLPVSGVVRRGGDGRGAWAQRTPEVRLLEMVDLGKAAVTGRFRLILSTPGLFPDGWLPFGVDTKNCVLHWSIDGLEMSAKLVAAAVGRFGVVSGWDLAREQPKTAQRMVPAWSVYWFDRAEGEVKEVLERIVKGGLWEVTREIWDAEGKDESVLSWRERRADGFNNALIGLWPKD